MNNGIQNVTQSLQNLKESLVEFSPEPTAVDSKEESPQKIFRSELKTLNSKNEYDTIDVHSDVEFDF